MSPWYVLIHCDMFGFSHTNQDTDIIDQFDRMDMNMDNASAMLQALCEADGLDVSSIINEEDSRPSQMSSPHLTAAAPVGSDESNTDGDGDGCDM